MPYAGIPISIKGAAHGVAALDADGRLLAGQSHVVHKAVFHEAVSGNVGDPEVVTHTVAFAAGELGPNDWIVVETLHHGFSGPHTAFTHFEGAPLAGQTDEGATAMGRLVIFQYPADDRPAALGWGLRVLGETLNQGRQWTASSGTDFTDAWSFTLEHEFEANTVPGGCRFATQVYVIRGGNA